MENRLIPHLDVSLGAQTSVWAAIRAYSKIRKQEFNLVISLIVPAVILVLAIFSSDKHLDAAASSYNAVNSLADIFFTYSVGITGFLIAGVSILVSVNDKDLFIIMAKTKYKQFDGNYSQYSQFQFIFFSLIVALSYHLILLSVTVLLKFLTSEGVFLTVSIQCVLDFSEPVIYFINCSALAALAWLFTRCLLLVKSVIWNVYQMVVLTILWADHVQTEATKKQQPLKKGSAYIPRAARRRGRS